MSFACKLSDRSVIRLSGAEAHSFLQGIVTQDIGLLDRLPCLYTLMLSAQGKYQHDFFVHRAGEALLLDIAATQKDSLLKKLKMYRLRAKVEIADEAAKWHIIAVWGKGMAEVLWPEKSIRATDPRLPGMGMRCLLPMGENFQSPGMEIVAEDAYHTHRLSFGMPDGALDADSRDVALELNADQLAAVSFDKGCYVGQEVTARTHYRGVLRKCLHRITAERSRLPAAGTPVFAGDKEIGQMRSSQGNTGLAMVRIAELAEAHTRAVPLRAADTPVSIQAPDYMKEKIASLSNDEEGTAEGASEPL